MAKRKLSSAELLRGISSLKPYPAVFTSAQGGFEVVFPNFPARLSQAKLGRAYLLGGRSFL